MIAKIDVINETNSKSYELIRKQTPPYIKNNQKKTRIYNIDENIDVAIWQILKLKTDVAEIYNASKIVEMIKTMDGKRNLQIGPSNIRRKWTNIRFQQQKHRQRTKHRNVRPLANRCYSYEIKYALHSIPSTTQII